MNLPSSGVRTMKMTLSLLVLAGLLTMSLGCKGETTAVPPTTTNGDPSAKKNDEYAKTMNESVNKTREEQGAGGAAPAGDK